MVQSQIAEQKELISGKGLYVALIIVLSGIAVLTDYASGRINTPLASITVSFLSTAIAVSALGYWVVPLLRKLKAGQVIREDGPQKHLEKAGTPTMGGVFFIPIALTLSLAWSTLASETVPKEVFACCFLTIVLGSLGWIDDLQVLIKKSNKGISAKLRLAIEILSGGLFAYWLITSQTDITTLQFPFGLSLFIGFGFIFLAVFVVAAESNAVNLTDGMDGLAAGTTAIALMGLGLVVAQDWPNLLIFCACMSGGCVGFLLHNHNPAKVFMGDTGSLALGAALAAVGLISNSLWALLILSGLFLVESLSVIVQVLFYKATKNEQGVGKRLFKMAPLHHHFELSGWKETKVVGVFYLVVAGLCGISLGLNAI